LGAVKNFAFVFWELRAGGAKSEKDKTKPKNKEGFLKTDELRQCRRKQHPPRFFF